MILITSMLIALSEGIPGLVVAGLAMFLMLLALIRKEASLMMLAALFTLPFAYAFGAWAGLLLFVRLLPVFPLLSALSISRDDTLLAWIFPLPSFVYLIYMIFNLIVFGFRG